MTTVHNKTSSQSSEVVVSDTQAQVSPQHGQKLLGWEEIHALFPDLPADPCKRFDLLADLYLDGQCTEEVFQELQQLESDCGKSELLKQKGALKKQIVTCLENMEITITSEEAEASLSHLLEHRWHELNLDELGLNELREDVLNHQTPTPESMQIEYHPTARHQRSKRRLISGLCTVAAAAILFAYGPNLIESNIGKREAQFPAVSQDVASQIAISHAPLSSQEGQKLSLSTQATQLTLSQITMKQVGDKTSSHLTYTLLSTSPSGDREIHVDLWRKKVTSQQQIGFKTQLARSSASGEVKVVLDSGRPIQVRSYQVPNSDLNIVEYLVKDQHYQWSAQLQDQDHQTLMTLVRSHFKELAQ